GAGTCRPCRRPVGDALAAPGSSAVHPQAREAAGRLRGRLGAGCDGRGPDLLRDRRAERPLGHHQGRWLPDRLGGLRGHGDRREPGRAARRPHRPTLRVRSDPAHLRRGDRCLRPVHRTRDADRTALRGRAGPGCRAAGRLDPDERVRSGPDPRPGDRVARGVLGAGLDPGRGGRHLRGCRGAQRLAMGAGDGHDPGAVLAGDPARRGGVPMGRCPALCCLVLRLGMPGSVRFLEQQGRHAEAERVVRSFEESAGIPAPAAAGTGPTSEASAASEGTAGSEDTAVSEGDGIPAAAASAAKQGIWSPALRRRTAGLWAVWFCINLSYYGAFIWIPTLLVDRGFGLPQSFAFTLIITLAQIPGYAVSAWLIEVIGRRWTLTVFLAGSAVAATAFGLADSEAMIIVSGCALSFFNLGAW